MLLLLLAHLLVNAVSAEIGLRNSKWKEQQTQLFGKKDWFTHLESEGVKSGFQTDPVHGLCPFATPPHILRTPACLEQKYVIVAGDSTMRELSWSLARLASTDGTLPCQQVVATPSRSFGDTRDQPSFGCTVFRNGTQLCPANNQRESNLTNCCKTFQSFYLSQVRPGNDVLAAIADIEKACDCAGVLLIGYGVHQLLDATLAGDNVATPWSYPFGRKTGWHSFRNQMSANSKLKMVIVSPTHLDEYVLMLHPPKPDWRAFAQFSTMAIWNQLDSEAAVELGVGFVSFYNITRRYKGLQCDGMHFGSSYDRMDWDCHGFTVVSDVAMQHALHVLCSSHRLAV